MANSIALITKYSTQAWDKVYKAEAISSLLDGDRELLKFTGTKTVKIAKYSSSGLGDYNRANAQVEGNYAGSETAGGTSSPVKGYGYQQGDVNLEWEEFTLRCDRAVQLRIELADDEETDGLAVAMATKETTRTKVVPEVDAYVFSKLAEYAGTKITDEAISLKEGVVGYQPEGPIQRLNDAFTILADNEVPAEDQIIFCSNSFYNMLRSTGEVVKTLEQNEYGQDVKFTIGSYEGRKIIPVPATRFRTDILLKGSDGYGWKTGSKAIDFIIVAKSAVAHVTKYDKVKVFGPNVVQDFDGYKVNIRVYHDVFVPDNKRIAVYAHISNATSATVLPTPSLIYSYDADTKFLSGVSALPGDTIADGLYAYKGNKPAVGTAVDDTFLASCTTVANYSNLSLAAGTYYLIATYKGEVAAVANTAITIA